MDTEKIIESIGGFSRFHVYLLFCSTYSISISSIMLFVPVYVANRQEIYCIIQSNSTIKNLIESADILNESISADVYKININSCKMQTINKYCTEISFDEHPFYNTIIMKFHLFCKEYSMYTVYVNAVCQIGILFGNLIFGYLSDRYGRLIFVSLSSILCCTVTLVGTFVENYWVYLTMRFLVGVGISGLNIGTNSYIIEALPIKYRMPGCLICWTGMNSGYLIICIIGYLIRDSTFIQIVAALINIPIFFFFLILPESFKWLISKQKFAKCVKSIDFISKFNGVQYDTNVLNEDFEKLQQAHDDTQPGDREDIKKFINFKSLVCYLIIFCYLFFMSSMTYITLSLGVSNFFPNIFVGAFGISIVSITLRTFLVIGSFYIGRTTLMSVSYLGTFIFLLLGGIMKWLVLEPIVILISLVCATVFVDGSFSLLWIYSGEIFPSNVRSITVSVGSSFARLGGFFATFCIVIDDYYPGLYHILTSGFIGLALILVILKLPETKGLTTFDKMVDAQAAMITQERYCLKNTITNYDPKLR